MLTVLRTSAAAAATFAALALLAAGNDAVAQQQRVVWQGAGWSVHAVATATNAKGCFATRSFASANSPGRVASWGFLNNAAGRWGLVVAGPAITRMVGQPAVIQVDGKPIHATTPKPASGGLVMFGEMSISSMKQIASGRTLSIATARNSATFSLAGADTALAATLRCTESTKHTASTDNTSEANRSKPPANAALPGDRSVRLSTGTGFYVSKTGQVLTNAHVVKGCAAVAIKGNGDTTARKVSVQASDAASDLALLSLVDTPSAPPPALLWRRDVRLGEEIAIFGFPYVGTLAISGTFTRGDVTALAGLANNNAHFQLSAPVQPGNSGGPVVDERGNVVGVVVAKLNALAVAKAGGDIPQNVNFAIKSGQALTFLETHGVAVPSANTTTARLSGPDMAERLQNGSVLVVCAGGSTSTKRRT